MKIKQEHGKNSFIAVLCLPVKSMNLFYIAEKFSDIVQSKIFIMIVHPVFKITLKT